MTDETVSEPSSNRKGTGRAAELSELLSAAASAPSDISTGPLRAVGALVVDAIRDDDEMALSVAARGLQYLHRLQRRLPNPAASRYAPLA